MAGELIYQLIPRVMADVGAIEKGRKNTQQGYAFRGVDDVMGAFQKPLAQHGIFYVPEVLSRETVERQSSKGNALYYTTLTMAYTFYASDGSSVRAVVVGEAMDSADKSSNKAMSAALKYALLQVFCVPVDASDDADNETHDVAPKGKQVQPPAKNESAPTAAKAASLAGQLIKLGATDEQLLKGVHNMTDTWLPGLQVEHFNALKPEQLAKVAASFQRKIEEKQRA